MSRGFGHSGITNLRLRRLAKIDLATLMMGQGASRKEIHTALERQFGKGLDESTLRRLRKHCEPKAIEAPMRMFDDDQKLEALIYAEENGDIDAMHRFGIPRETFVVWKEAAAMPKQPNAQTPVELSHHKEVPVQEQATTLQRGPTRPWKYSPEQVNSAARMVLDGMPYADIAKQTGVSMSTVTSIAHNRHGSVNADLRDKLAAIDEHKSLGDAQVPDDTSLVIQLQNQVDAARVNSRDATRRINELEALVSKSTARVREKDAAIEQGVERMKAQDVAIQGLQARIREYEKAVDELRAALVEAKQTPPSVNATELGKLRNEAALLRKKMGEVLVEAMLSKGDL